MQCLILAGGLGTRMKSIAGDKPKALLPVGPQTFIDWQLQWLKIMGVTDIVLALGHGGEDIVRHIEERQSDLSYPQVNYSFDGPELLGTGGAIRNAEKMLSPDFIVTYGDTVLFLDVKKLIKRHQSAGKPVTMTILKNEDIGDLSNVIYKNGEILLYDKFNRTAEMQYIDYGMTVVNKKYFLEKAPRGKFDYAGFLIQASKERAVTAYEVQELFREVGSAQGYQGFCDLLKSFDYDLGKMAKAMLPAKMATD